MDCKRRKNSSSGVRVGWRLEVGAQWTTMKALYTWVLSRQLLWVLEKCDKNEV